MDPLSYVFSLEQFGIKFGLENIRALLGRLGNPERAYRTVHVAGTNGKGSVTAIVDAALRAAGHHVGRYTSPHLIDLNERYVVNGRPVETDRLVDVAALVRDTIESMIAGGALDVHPTYFEATTAIGFELFRRAGVDVATIEVGLGGRLDATNVITPMATAITSIAFDHEQYLGRTLAGIASEKAGILKPGVPVVLGPRLRPEARDVILRRANDVGAPAFMAATGVEVTGHIDPQRFRLRTAAHDYGEVTLALRGAHQVSNATTAVRLLELLDERGLAVPATAIVRGLETVSWPGRLDLRRFEDGREALLDAAHNGEGAAALATYLASAGAPLPIVFAAMRDKDVSTMFRHLLPAASVLFVTRPSTTRAAEPEILAAEARRVRPGLEIVIEPAVPRAVARAWERGRRIVIAGSIFLLGEVYKEFGGLPGTS